MCACAAKRVWNDDPTPVNNREGGEISHQQMAGPIFVARCSHGKTRKKTMFKEKAGCLPGAKLYSTLYVGNEWGGGGRGGGIE